MGTLLTDIADLVLGRRCSGCDEGSTLLCPACDATIQGRAHIVRDLRFNDIQEDLRIPLAAAHTYTPPMSTLIYRYKDAHIPALAPILAGYLENAINVLAIAPDPTLVPIPTRKAATRRRGFDSMGLISRHLQKSGHRVEISLTDNRSAGTSKSLDSRLRSLEVQDAFAITSAAQGLIRKMTPVILFDDVTTTGSTLKEAATVLMQAGVHVVGAAAIAGARKR